MLQSRVACCRNGFFGKARAALAEQPDHEGRKLAARRAERVLDNSRYYRHAREFARMASSECQIDGRCEYVVVTGGGPGIKSDKEAAADGVTVGPLTRVEIERVLENHFGVAGIPLDLLESLEGNTRGAAALLEQTLAELWGEGNLHYCVNDGVLGLQWNAGAALPKSLLQVIEQRISGLDGAGRQAMEMRFFIVRSVCS